MSIFYNWITLAVLAGLASNAFNFINRYIMRNGEDAAAYAWYTELIRLIAFGLLATIDWHLVLTPYSLALFIILGLSEFAGGYFFMKMHEYSELSISTILSRTRMVWVPILAFFMISELLNVLNYVGIFITFVGISLAVAPKKLFVDKGAIYANLLGFFVAFITVIMKMLLPFGSTAVINFFMVLPAVFLFPLLIKNSRKRIPAIFKNNLRLKTTAVILSILQLFIFTIALRYGDASKVNALYQGMMIFAVLAGIIFLKERENVIRKLGGAVVTLVGVLLLTT